MPRIVGAFHDRLFAPAPPSGHPQRLVPELYSRPQSPTEAIPAVSDTEDGVVDEDEPMHGDEDDSEPDEHPRGPRLDAEQLVISAQVKFKSKYAGEGLPFSIVHRIKGPSWTQNLEDGLWYPEPGMYEQDEHGIWHKEQRDPTPSSPPHASSSSAPQVPLAKAQTPLFLPSPRPSAPPVSFSLKILFFSSLSTPDALSVSLSSPSSC